MWSEIFEIIMVVLFGVSWPTNIARSARAKTAKGKSVLFLFLILIGYVAGILSKFLNQAYFDEIATKWYVLFFYFLNAAMVIVDICLYFRNRRLDRQREALEKANAESVAEESASEDSSPSDKA